MPAIRSKRNDENIDPSQGDPFQIASIPEGSKARKAKNSNKKKSPAVANAPYSIPEARAKRGRPFTKNHPDHDNPFEDLEDTGLVLCPWPAHGAGCSDPLSHGAWECPTSGPCNVTIAPSRDLIGDHLTSHHGEELPAEQTALVDCHLPKCRLRGPIQRASLARHIRESHMKLNKLTCVWCGDQQRRSEYYNRHGPAAQCSERRVCLSKLAFAPSPEEFKQRMDVLLARGGNMFAIADMIFAGKHDAVWVGWLFWSAYALFIFELLPWVPLPPLAPMPQEALVVAAADPSEPSLLDQATILT